MKCPRLSDLPAPPMGKKGWPWTEETPPVDRPAVGEANWPRVSIVAPCYNSGRYLEESIRSVLLQGYPDVEYIIMDGGSSDNSVEIIKKYAPWLAYWESQPDRGQSHAINKGLGRCTGKYFNWHNADDILLPGNFINTVQGFSRYPAASYLCRYRLLMDETTGSVWPKQVDMAEKRLDEKQSFIRLSAGNQPGGLMRLDFVRDVGGVDETLHIAMDEDLQLRLLSKGPAYYLEGAGVIFRLHAAQKTQALYRIRISDKLCVFKKIYGEMEPDNPRQEFRRESLIFANRWSATLALQNWNPFLWFKYRLAAFRCGIRR